MTGEPERSGAGAGDEPRVALPRGRRVLLLAVGWLFVALGAAGVVLPLLPTTPLLLLALWAFSASSERLHRWLYEHRLFGPPLQAWRRDRVIPLRAKLVALASMAASLVYAGGVRRSPTWVLALMAAVMLAGALFLARFPSRPPGARGDARG